MRRSYENRTKNSVVLMVSEFCKRLKEQLEGKERLEERRSMEGENKTEKQEKSQKKGLFSFWKSQKEDKEQVPKNSVGSGRVGKKREDALKKNTMLRVGRVLLWGMLGFIFLRGLIGIFRPDTTSEARQLITDFKRQLETDKKLNNEILSFAQDFVREYLSYTAREETEYKERLKEYLADRVSIPSLELSYGSAQAEYVQAYRLESYGTDQWDVFVLAEVVYHLGKEEETQKIQTFLKVPVFVAGEQMVIEDLPLYVNDERKFQKYEGTEYTGTSLSEASSAEVVTAVTNFLTAYYEQNETAIAYYLSQSADSEDFIGLQGKYRFVSLEKIRCYQESGQQTVVCIVEVKIEDTVNQAKYLQKMNLQVQQSGDRYYIQSINARTGNLSF